MAGSRGGCGFGAFLLIAASACGGGRVTPLVLEAGGADSGGYGGLGGGAGTSGAPSGGTGAAGGPAPAGASGGGTGGAGAANGCDEGSARLAPWPGKGTVTTLDAEADFESDLSGLTYEAPDVLWAVDNLRGKLHRLLRQTSGFAADAANGWASGKTLRFPHGHGLPDAEGVTLGASSADGVYVCSERDNEDALVSRLSVLRYDVAGADTALRAIQEWDVTALLPATGSNTGLEAITWVPDAFLVEHGFVDEGRGSLYAPAAYGDHGAGLFFVGVEGTGKIYGLALDHARGTASLVTSITTPFAGVMGLEFDRDAGALWFSCDDTCDNQTGMLRVEPALGTFVLQRLFARPSGLPNSNHEGFAIGPDVECHDDGKPFYWADDADMGGFSVRVGSVPCFCP